jgi:hypothetical protein
MPDIQSQPTMGEYLVREGFITQSQFNKALAEQNSSAKSLGRILVDLGLITESVRINILQKRFGFELIKLKEFKADMAILSRIPYNFAEKHRVIPLAVDQANTLVVAMEDPSDILVVDMIKNQVGSLIRPCVASNEDIQHVLDQYSTGSDAFTTARKKEEQARGPKPQSRAMRLMRNVAVPLLMFLPLALFMLAIRIDLFGAANWLQGLYSSGFINSTFDICIYIALIWGLWSVIIYEVNALIFGKRKDEDQDLI